MRNNRERFDSVDSDIRGRDHFSPFDDFIAVELSELRGRSAGGLSTIGTKPLPVPVEPKLSDSGCAPARYNFLIYQTLSTSSIIV